MPSCSTAHNSLLSRDISLFVLLESLGVCVIVAGFLIFSTFKVVFIIRIISLVRSYCSGVTDRIINNL